MAQDIAQATVFVQQNAARLGLAQRPYAMLGHSAGGFLGRPARHRQPPICARPAPSPAIWQP